MARPRGKVELRRKLNAFDVTNLVIGSIIGADVYVATGLSAQLVGPSSLVIWVLAGLMAMVIAICFAYCVMLMPRVGGPYAYVKDVSTPFVGFEIGWALLLAEWFSLAVFPVAFATYFASLVPGIDALGIVLLKAFFIAFVIVTNVFSVRAAGRTNDVLTIVKILPLVLIIIGGILFFLYDPSVLGGNMTPFVTGDFAAFGTALILVFWAYAGFELATLPANDVERPERTIPKAIVFGMLFVVAFYLLTNLVVVGAVGTSALSTTSTPLILAAQTIFTGPILGVVMVAIVGIGALFSILGADESGTIGTSRLAYAMSLDGLLPRSFAKLHPRYGTPYVSLIVLCSLAFVASIFGGLQTLIDSSVFLLAFVYLATCLSALRLERKHPTEASGLRLRTLIPVLGAAFSFVLLLLVDPIEMAVSIILLAAGFFVYAYFSPKKELAEAKALFLSEEAMLRRAARTRTAFLAHPVFHLKRWIYRRRNVEPAIVVTYPEEPEKEQMM